MNGSQARPLSAAILGMAVGDALGLPYEGLSPRHGRALFGSPDRYRFLFRRGMVSDDTEHACFTAQALIASAADPDVFLRQLARRMRWWFVGISAGLGRATLKSSLRLWFGASPERSGIDSAGNGGVMRSLILGAAFPRDLEQLRQLVSSSTRMTHRNPKAELGSWVIALAAAHAVTAEEISPVSFRELLAQHVDWDDEGQFCELVDRALCSVEAGESTTEFAATMEPRRGVTGYIVHTTPAVIHAWLRHGADFSGGVQEIIRCGGDADTTASCVGGLIAAQHGIECIPQRWLDGLCEWPRTVDWMDRLGQQLQDVVRSGKPQQPLRLPWWGLFPRNLIFLALVLFHVLRRALPPYR